jgi:hypothetical protein
MLALRAMPCIIASQRYPLANQIAGTTIALCIVNQNDPVPAQTQTPTIKATHALALAFFISLTLNLFKDHANVMTAKTLIDAGLTATFLCLAGKAEASNTR